MRENTASVTTIMDAKIERCVEPLFSGGRGREKKKNDENKDDGEKKNILALMMRTKRRKIFELTTKVYALCALNGDLDLENAIERVDLLLLALQSDDTDDDEDLNRGSWAKTKIEKQLRMKQRRLKERKDPFAEKEWVRFLAREEGKEILEELFRMVLSSSVSSSSSSFSSAAAGEDIRELFFHRYVVMFVTKEKYDARARASLRRMASVLNEYYEEYIIVDGDDKSNKNHKKKRVFIDWRKDVCKFEAAFAWHVIRGAREQMKRATEGSGIESTGTTTTTTTGGSWLMSKIRGGEGGGSSASGSSVSIVSEEDAKNVTSKFGKYLTLGAAAVVGGSLLTLTGGLAAPALIASVGGLAASGSVFAVFGVGTAYVLGVLGTTGVTAIFGVTGAGLAAHKMSKRIEQNLEIFRILPLRDGGLLLGRKKPSNGEDKDEDEEDQGFDTIMNASLNVVLYVPGFLKSGPDELFDAFGSKNGNYYATVDGDGPLGLRVMKVKSKEDIKKYAEKSDRLRKLAHLGGNEYTNNADIDADTLLIVEHDAKTLDDNSGVAKNAGILSGSAILSYHILETNERIIVDSNNSSYQAHVATLKAIERAPRPVRLQMRKIQKLEIDREEIADVALSINEDLEELVENVAKEEKEREETVDCESPSSSHSSEKPKPPAKKEDVDDVGERESNANANHQNLLMRTLTRTISSPTITTATESKSTAEEEEDEAMGTNTNWPIHSGEQFVLEWETTELTNLGSAITFFARKTLVNAAAPQALGHTVFAGLAASVSWPAILLGGASFIDNPWSVLKERAQIAGKELVTILLSREHGRRAVTLIAYSTGTCVILECLKELDRMIEDGTCLERDALGIVENVVLISVPVHVGRKDWRKIRRVTSGRVVNCRAKNDWVLRFIYRLKSYDVISSLAGVVRQNYEGVEDIKLSGDICYAHGDIPKAMGDILKVVGLETEESANAFGDTAAAHNIREDENESSFEQRGESNSSIVLSESDYDSENEADFAAHQETIY